MPIKTPVFLIHGLGSHAWSLWPLQTYLNHEGYINCYCIEYPVDQMIDLEEMLDFVDVEMQKCAKKKRSVILIGQSMGGVVSNRLHTKGWKIRMAIYIGSPLHGARLLNQLDRRLPIWVRNELFKKPYEILMSKTREVEPPHPYRTISMGWFWTHFDGCVYVDETILNMRHHTHLQWADHRTVFLNPRLWCVVAEQLTFARRISTTPRTH